MKRFLIFLVALGAGPLLALTLERPGTFMLTLSQYLRARSDVRAGAFAQP